MTEKLIRIGGGCAFYGDTAVAPPQLIEAGVDYLVLDYLAEATMSVLGHVRAANPKAGFARDFTEAVVRDNLAAIVRTGVKIVTNAGGVNPRACKARVEAIAAEAGVKLRIALVEGDDVSDRLSEFAASGAVEMFSGAEFPKLESVVSANVYLGAFPIARALALGADIVITGRVVDSALTLGPLIHEFGWREDQYDLLAAGSLAGHVIECGAQATGGLFTDWRRVPDWAHIGYPIIECHADGAFIVGKPEGTGGLVETAVVAEQILYETGDPQAYILPDVVCDFANVTLTQVGENRVRVAGAVGYPPTGRYKVSITFADGWRAFGAIAIVGRDAAEKAARQADAFLTRLDEMLRARNYPPFRARRVEIIGAETSFGANARAGQTREVLTKIGVEHVDQQALRLFVREFDAPVTSMAPGSTAWFANRPDVGAVDRVFSMTIDPATLKQVVSCDGREEIVDVAKPAQTFTFGHIVRRVAEPSQLLPCDALVILADLAWARSGDKGDAFNVGVIARRPEYLPYIRAALTEAAVFEYFAHEFEDARAPKVTRFEAPGLHALNFLCEQALGGGQRASLRLDPLAKGKAQQLLEFSIPVPKALAETL